MHILIIGGSGIVGSIVMPFLAEVHTLRVFDLNPPQVADYPFHQGNVNNIDDLTAAMQGIDAVLYMAMGHIDWQEPFGVTSAFDVNIKGVYLSLKAAHESGITQGVYTSSMSVYGGDLMNRTFPDEVLTPDATGLYGLTKYLGELVCLNAVREWGMNVNALRLCHPIPEDKWLEQATLGVPTIHTTAQDVANAMLAALNYEGGFQTFTISGDYEQKVMNMSKAKRLLGWEPLARPNK